MSPTKIIAVGCLALAACGGDFDPGSRVTKLRLLAVQSSPPSARGGAVVKLDALASDPLSRTISWAIATCVDPASSGVEDCVRAAGPLVSASPPFTVSVPATAKTMVGVVVVACPGIIGGGDTQSIPVTCSAFGRNLRLDEFEIGVKRIFVSDGANANPGIESVSFDGTPWGETDVREVSACATTGNRITECNDADEHSISVTTTAIDPEEQTVVEYYATEGLFENEVKIASAPDTKWAARSQAAGKLVTMYIVIRDSRGGVSWTTRQVRVRP